MKKTKANSKTDRTLIFDEEGLVMLAERLRKVRKDCGFTQEKLSLDSGITLSQIARIETAKINPTVSTLFRFARTMRVPVSVFFDFELTPWEME